MPVARETESARCGLPAVAWLLVTSSLLLAACTKPAPQVLGTLEYERITLPSPAAERIVSVAMREGQRVAEGSILLQLDPSHAQALLDADQALMEQQEQVLRELQAGPRIEAIARARAQLASAEAEARRAQIERKRVQELVRKGFASSADLDRAREAAAVADGQVEVARAALKELEHGTRPEQLAQAEAALNAVRARVEADRVLMSKLEVRAPREGVVDSIPYKLGDQAPVGAPLAILLVGEAPYARIYVPASLRMKIKQGDVVQVHVADRTWPGHVRMIRSEPVFTPYFALTGEDAARLSYLAEVDLGHEAVELPAGLPVRVDLRSRTQ
ncbi:MAG TPA: HlyD family efflux transporter periplasmic adaptor subunit [Chiayiivirga sp.]|nr:HlyD family efflux transporter periplasmic adaptor subunit [Chiayiivirga sp.]